MENLLWACAGLAMFVAGVPLFLQKVPPNHWYGFRLPKTRRDPYIWYAANRTAGFDLCVAGGVMMAVALFTTMLASLLAVPPALLHQVNYSVFWVALGCVVVHSLWELRKL